MKNSDLNELTDKPQPHSKGSSLLRTRERKKDNSSNNIFLSKVNSQFHRPPKVSRLFSGGDYRRRTTNLEVSKKEGSPTSKLNQQLVDLSKMGKDLN